MIKRLLATTFIALCSMLGISSCTAKTSVSNTNTNQKTEKMTTDGKKLVVFFSHTGENYNVGYIEKGNTHIIADMIADAMGADRFEIVPEKGVK